MNMRYLGFDSGVIVIVYTVGKGRAIRRLADIYLVMALSFSWFDRLFDVWFDRSNFNVVSR